MVVGDLADSTEVAVIGAGPGGYVAAIRLAQYGVEVALISADPLPGGTCLLRGCIPSKALIEAGNLWRRLHEAKALGLEFRDAKIEWPRTQKWKQGIVEKLAGGVQQLLKQNGVNFLNGQARFLGPQLLEIQTASGKRQLRFQQAILATGSVPRPLPGFEFDGKKILSSEHALALPKIPPALLVIGGGYIGLELGEAYAQLGSTVTVMEATGELLPGMDPDLLRPLKRKLKDLKVEVLLETLARSARDSPTGIQVELEGEKTGKAMREFSHVLVAVGRQPFTEDLGLENLPLLLDPKGFIPINERCQTKLGHLYAIGDVAGGMLLAHKASREGLVAAAAIAGHADAFDNQVPAVIFTDPEIAYVGLFEAEAKQRGIEVQTGMFPFAANGRALTLNETEGFIKVVAEKSTKRILGVQMVGPHVSDLISEATLGIEMGASAEDFALTIHPHPTLSEALHEAMEGVLGIAIHRSQKR